MKTGGLKAAVLLVVMLWPQLALSGDGLPSEWQTGIATCPPPSHFVEDSLLGNIQFCRSCRFYGGAPDGMDPEQPSFGTLDVCIVCYVQTSGTRW